MGTFMEPDQLTLFDLGVDVAKLREKQARLLDHGEAENTRNAYASAWKQFLLWCEASGRRALPATEKTVCLYLTHLLEERKRKVTTAELHKAAIMAHHRAVGHALHINGGVSALLRGARRARAGVEKPAAKAALSVADLRKICKRLSTDDPVDIRDRAVLCLGFAGGFRRSDLVRLDVSDLLFERRGVLVKIRKGKTDQEGKGREVGLPKHSDKAADICPVRALRAWLDVRGKWEGPLFYGMRRGDQARLKGQAVCELVQRCVRLTGLDSDRYGAHSLRAGLVTACLAAGASELAVMQRTGHKQVSTLQRYLRPATAFQVDPLAKALA